MKKPKGYHGFAFTNPEEVYNKEYLTTEEGKEDVSKMYERNKKHQKHLEEYGWDETETWNLDNSITMFILPRLKHFSENVCGNPSTITLDEWKVALNKMVLGFELYSHEDNYFDEPDKLKIINEGLDLFRKYFMYLWD